MDKQREQVQALRAQIRTYTPLCTQSSKPTAQPKYATTVHETTRTMAEYDEAKKPPTEN